MRWIMIRKYLACLVFFLDDVGCLGELGLLIWSFWMLAETW